MQSKTPPDLQILTNSYQRKWTSYEFPLLVRFKHQDPSGLVYDIQGSPPIAVNQLSEYNHHRPKIPCESRTQSTVYANTIMIQPNKT